MNSNLLRSLIGLYFLMCAALTLSAQVVHDNNAQCTGGNADGSTLSLPGFTVPANNRAVLVVLVRSTQTQTVSTLTFNGQSLSRLGSVFSYVNARAEIWYLAMGNLSMPVTSNIDVVWTGNNIYRMLTALSAHNVDQTTPLDNLTGNSFPTTATSSSVTVAGNSGDLAVEAISCFGPSNLTPPVFTPTSGQTEFPSCTVTPIFTFRQSSAYKAQTGLTTLSWNVSNLEPTTNAGIQIAANIRANTALPVRLTNFQVQYRDRANQLIWETASERQSHYFEVQHSANGREFSALGQVEAAGESNALRHYAFSHDQSVAGTHYYRLKSVDRDGSFEFSPIISVVNGKAAGSISAYPNPARNQLSLQVVDRQQTTRLYDGQGRLVYASAVAPEQLDMSGLPEGGYVLQIGAAVMKVIKE